MSELRSSNTCPSIKEKKRNERGKEECQSYPEKWLLERYAIFAQIVHPRLSVSLIFGADAVEEEGVPGANTLLLSSSIASIGGLVANGDGTAAGNPNDERPLPPTGGPRLKPKFVNPEVVGGGGLVAEAEGVRGGGTVPLLNSAQRGHLRFVSKRC